MIIAALVILYVLIGLLVGGYFLARLEAKYDPDADLGAGLAGVFWPVVGLFMGFSFVVAFGKGLYR